MNKRKGLILAGVAAVAALALRRFVTGRRMAQDATPEVDPASLLDVLACPQCRAELTWHTAEQVFRCAACARDYPFREGIVHFVEPAEMGALNRRLAGLYDWFSWVYNLFAKVAFAYIGVSEDAARSELLAPLAPHGGRVLEVSIGPGPNLPYLLRRGDVGEVHGLDISIGQLRRCQSYARGRGWTVPLYLANAEALPFRAAAFDAVFHFGGINFFDNKANALSEMVRVATPGAVIVVADETEKGALAYEQTLPGFSRSFKGGRPPVVPPLDLLPTGLEDVRLDELWKGWMWRLTFRKPDA